MAASASTAHAGSALASFVVNQQNELALQNLGSISITGSTGLRLHVDGGVPSGENGFWFASFEGTSAKPQLEVTYTTAP